MAVGHMALVATTGSAIAMALVLALAGGTIAPTYASVNAMVESVAPAGTVTEAFAWLNTAVGMGAALGSAVGGALAAGHGAGPAFVFAGAAGLAAAMLALRCETTESPVADASAA
jgi:MFS family permease